MLPAGFVRLKLTTLSKGSLVQQCETSIWLEIVSAFGFVSDKLRYGIRRLCIFDRFAVGRGVCGESGRTGWLQKRNPPDFTIGDMQSIAKVGINMPRQVWVRSHKGDGQALGGAALTGGWIWEDGPTSLPTRPRLRRIWGGGGNFWVFCDSFRVNWNFFVDKIE